MIGNQWLNKCVLAGLLFMALWGATVFAAPVPTFSATASGTTSNLTLTASLSIGDADVGQYGNIYLAAMVGSAWFAHNGADWVSWSGGSLPVYAVGSLTNRSIEVVRNANLSALVGTQIYVGYGLNESDMLANGKFGLVYTVGSAAFSGTAAVGAPIANGDVTVIDATGATVGTTTTGSDGSYTLSFDHTRVTAPFVTTVTGNIGDASITLVSVQASQPTSGSSDTVNITPITNAIAARLSSTGNPADLATDIATEKANITSTTVATIEQAFRDILTPNMSAVGLAPTVNLISGTFSTQLDKLLDNIQIQVTTTGDIQMTSSSGAAVNDLAPTTTPPAAVQVATLPKSTALSTGTVSSLRTNLPAPSGTPVGADVLTAALTKLNACFAVVPASARADASACANIVSSSYLHDGLSGTAQLSGLHGDSGNDNMQFKTSEILRQLDTTANAEKLIVRLSAVRTDGQFRDIVTVAQNKGGWELIGNQRVFATFVNGVAIKRVNPNTPTRNRYETGMSLNVSANANIASAVVTGPGLPAGGIILKSKAGCDFLAIVPALGTLTNNVPCAALYRVRSLLTNGVTAYTPTSNTHLFASPQLSDADIQTIQPLDLYKFVITKTDATTLTYWNRLRSRPLTVAEMAKVQFVNFTPTTMALMTTATLYTGGAAPTVSWTVPANGPRPFRVMFFHAGGSDFKNVPFGTSSATIPCTGNTDCSGSNYNTHLTTTEQYLFQIIARDRFDNQIFTQLAP